MNELAHGENTRRNTPQRAAILRVLREAGEPIAALQVHERAQQILPGVSHATVYRALQRLQEEGGLRCVAPHKEAARYALLGVSHDHFYCRACRQAFDFAAQTLDVAPFLPDGFRIEGRELRFHGLCPDCALQTP